jgi:hypothetical protein
MREVALAAAAPDDDDDGRGDDDVRAPIRRFAHTAVVAAGGVAALKGRTAEHLSIEGEQTRPPDAPGSLLGGNSSEQDAAGTRELEGTAAGEVGGRIRRQLRASLHRRRGVPPPLPLGTVGTLQLIRECHRLLRLHSRRTSEEAQPSGVVGRLGRSCPALAEMASRSPSPRASWRATP